MVAARGVGMAFGCTLALLPAAARAYPQWTVNASAGVGRALGPPEVRAWRLTLGLRSDVTFGARTPYAPRVGPWLALRTDDFARASLAAGALVQLPVSPTFPVIASLGAVAETAGDAPRGGALARLWWGTRSLNYHRSYGMSFGVWCEARFFPAVGVSPAVGDVVLGVDFDMAFASLPVVLLYEWIRR